MRFPPVHHVIGTATVLALILCYLVSLVFEYIPLRLEDDIDGEELLSAEAGLHNQSIPKIIHQIYFGWDNSTIPSHWEAPRQSCIDLHPDYENKLWNASEARNLLETDFPWFLETWENYRYGVQRSDSIRYFILWKYGGIYVDMDNGCNRRLDPLLSYPAWTAKTPVNTAFLGIHLMGSVPHHPFFKMAISSLQAYDINWVFPHLTIYNSAGPHFATFVRTQYYHNRRAHPDTAGPPVRILMPSEQGEHPWSFFTQAQGHSWERQDTKFLQWMAKRPILLLILAVGGLAVTSISIWWVCWSGALYAQRLLDKARGRYYMRRTGWLPKWTDEAYIDQEEVKFCRE